MYSIQIITSMESPYNDRNPSVCARGGGGGGGGGVQESERESEKDKVRSNVNHSAYLNTDFRKAAR